MIVVIADDLSGAAELAGVAHLRGRTAEVQTTFAADAGVDVVCVDSGTRALRPAEAARVAGDVVREVVGAEPDWIYLKYDSVLRGNVLAELRAALAATGQRSALLVPANPSRGRVIRDGSYFIDGLPLHETAFARDPEHPRLSARVAELLGGGAPEAATPDVESSADLARLAAGVGPDTLPAGAAEFFGALLARHTHPLPDGPSVASGRRAAPEAEAADRPVTLLACGSLASWETRRREAHGRGVRVFALPRDVTVVVRALERDRIALIGIGDAEGTHEVRPPALTRILAGRVAEVTRRVALDHLLLEGGATAAAVVRRLGWSRLRTLDPGGSAVGALLPTYPDAPTLFIKPGSYPWPERLW